MDETTAQKLKAIRARKMAEDPEGMKARKRTYDKARYAAKRNELSALAQTRRASMTDAQRLARSETARRWRAKNPDKVRSYMTAKRESGYFREWNRKRRAEDPEKVRRSARAVRLKSKYGVTIERYEEMHADQRGLCAICGRPETLVIKGVACTLAVDHDAETGRVRGLLCVNCNMLIGGARHDPLVLQAAIAYLMRSSS